MTKRIIPLFANEDNGIYGDIYNSPEEVLEDHPGATIIHGYGIMDDETGFIADETEDFYFTEAAALEDLKKL